MTRIATVAIALVLTTACQAIPGMNLNNGVQGAHTGDSYMTGRMSTVNSFDDDLSVNSARVDRDGWLTVDLHVEGRYGWVMLAGDVDINGMQPGDTLQLTQDELYDFVGCAGPKSYKFDYDDTPTSVTITLAEPEAVDAPGTDVGVERPGTENVDVIIDADFGTEGGVTAVTTVPRQG